MLHQKIAPSAKRERSDCRFWAQKPLVVAVIRNAISSTGIVVDQAKIICSSCEDLRELPQLIKASGKRPRFACLIAIKRDGFLCIAVYKLTRRIESRRLIDTEYGGAEWVRPLSMQEAIDAYNLGVLISVSKDPRFILYLTR